MTCPHCGEPVGVGLRTHAAKSLAYRAHVANFHPEHYQPSAVAPLLVHT